MLPFEELAAFAAVVDAGGFSAAARQLGQSKATISDQVKRLEQRLGARLLNRTTRRVAVTEAGAACHAHCVRMRHEAEAAARVAETLQAEPVVRLRSTAPQTFAPLHVAPVVASFAALYPRLDIELSVTPGRADLIGGGLDLAIRIGTLPDSRLVARRIGVTRQILVAAPAYLAREGRPQSSSDLHSHAALIFTPLTPNGEWSIADPNGRVKRVPVRARLASDAGEALLAAAVAGMGIAYVPDWMVHAELVSGALEVVLPGWGRPPQPIHAVHASAGQPPAKVRLFIEHLRVHFGDPPRWALVPGLDSA